MCLHKQCVYLRGGGFSPDFCWNTILRYELAMMARTCTNNLRVVFSPYVQHCPCEASEQKWGQKTNILNKEIELSIVFHSIRLNELVILVCSFVKI